MNQAAPRQARRRLLLAWPLALGMALSGCANRPDLAPGASPPPAWSGRLAVKIDSAPPQSFTASFELKGSAEQGSLGLYTPVGSTVAWLEWSPGHAELQARGERRQFDSVDALVAEATGTPLPLPALFHWLRGQPDEQGDWSADLSRIGEGRLVARRLQPLPEAELRVILDR
ncbi:MAG: hypothetical protein JOY84_05850 [Curvibacter sp.]|nr:hypothetical protein [Curvibacter sp.]